MAEDDPRLVWPLHGPLLVIRADCATRHKACVQRAALLPESFTGYWSKPDCWTSSPFEPRHVEFKSYVPWFFERKHDVSALRSANILEEAVWTDQGDGYSVSVSSTEVLQWPLIKANRNEHVALYSEAFRD